MNKNIILTTTVALLLATTSLMAESKCGMPNKGAMQNKCAYSKNAKMYYRGHHKGNQFVKMFMQLDLNDKQRADIRSILRANMKNRPNPSTMFTEGSFNKEGYVALMQTNQNTRAERKAQVIADAYAILTPAQKKDFKTMLDAKEIMKKNRTYKSFQ